MREEAMAVKGLALPANILFPNLWTEAVKADPIELDYSVTNYYVIKKVSNTSI